MLLCPRFVPEQPFLREWELGAAALRRRCRRCRSPRVGFGSSLKAARGGGDTGMVFWVPPPLGLTSRASRFDFVYSAGGSRRKERLVLGISEKKRGERASCCSLCAFACTGSRLKAATIASETRLVVEINGISHDRRLSPLVLRRRRLLLPLVDRGLFHVDVRCDEGRIF